MVSNGRCKILFLQHYSMKMTSFWSWQSNMRFACITLKYFKLHAIKRWREMRDAIKSMATAQMIWIKYFNCKLKNVTLSIFLTKRRANTTILAWIGSVFSIFFLFRSFLLIFFKRNFQIPYIAWIIKIDNTRHPSVSICSVCCFFWYFYAVSPNTALFMLTRHVHTKYFH